jgi:hypothetical protein
MIGMRSRRGRRAANDVEEAVGQRHGRVRRHHDRDEVASRVKRAVGNDEQLAREIAALAVHGLERPDTGGHPPDG